MVAGRMTSWAIDHTIISIIVYAKVLRLMDIEGFRVNTLFLSLSKCLIRNSSLKLVELSFGFPAKS